MFDAGYSITCRDAALPVGELYKLRDVGRCGRAPRRRPSAESDLLGAVVRATCRTSGASRRSIASSRTPTWDTASTGTARASCSTPPKGWPATTARCSSVCAASSPTSRSRARSRSPRPAPVIPPLSPGSRRERSTRAGALAEAYRRNNAGSYAGSRRILRGRRGAGDARSAAPKRLPTKRCRSRTSAAMPRPTHCSPRGRAGGCKTRSSLRRLRNYRAMHLLNQGDGKGAIAELEKPLPHIGGEGKRWREGPANRRRRRPGA